ncbi:glycine zipper 2TM domain-containing protein [Glaciecola sp. 1036]|uniref:glycine zipper 2TM domain-containing protein n=1 Tax=Alteromonadaceae TaxID=72275 RepID=UPI003D02BFE8
MKLIKLIKTSVISLVVVGLTSVPAFAHNGYKGHGNRGHGNKGVVISVKPIYAKFKGPRFNRDCQLPHHRNHRFESGHRGGHGYNISHSSHGIEPIVGAVIGGVVGNQFGSGRGKTAATVAGAAIGGAIGAELSSKHSTHSQINMHQSSRNHHRTSNNCSWGNDGFNKKHKTVIGYKVKYRYRGQIFTTRTQFHPGRYIHI